MKFYFCFRKNRSKKEHSGLYRLFISVVTWLNIITQIAFPITVAFSPSIVHAQNEIRLIPHDPVVKPIKTKKHILKIGESVQSITKKYNLTLQELSQLNQHKVFVHGFDNLQVGDEINVPVMPLPSLTWHDENSDPAPIQQDIQLQKIAGLTSQAGGFLANNPSGDAVSSMARGIAIREASSQIQQWLNRVGTARVQLDVDRNFSLKNSQLDLLAPLHEKKDRLVFTQGSLHRTDNRTQSNLGFGIRWFYDDWMLGGNTFLDYDLTLDHARIGGGVEYWRDFLKLGANSYQRLTNWKNSRDLMDYEERAANGWDLRAQAWLPSLPQLGGKLTYEQYYGNEVALFGKDNRQANPRAITGGITYTPFPLLTLSVEQSQGKSGESDSRFGIQMNYQLGMSWQQQINPNAVSAMRSLAGSRYDLVERNNNIVLEYRKKEVIYLQTADLVTGYAGEMKSLSVSVNSKYGLERIDWSASTLTAAGGKIVQNGDSSYSIVLPDYQSGPQSVNSWIISGVAVDKKGNFSKKADTQITLTHAAIHDGTSSLTPVEVSLPADGKTQEKLILKVNDSEGKPVDIEEDEISVHREAKLRGSTTTATLTSFSRRAAGEYEAILTAGTQPESFIITPSARNMVFKSASVTLAADHYTALISALDVVDNNATADGKSQNRVKIVVVDAMNNRVPSQTVSFKADNEASIDEFGITDSNGELIVTVTSNRAGDSRVTASINGESSKEATVTFLPNEDTAQIEVNNLTVMPETSPADGKTKKTITALVTDAQNNPVPAVIVAFSADNGASPDSASVKTDTHGFAITTLTSTVAGVSHVTATVNNNTTVKEATFTGDNSTAQVTSVTPSEGFYIADGETTVTFMAIIKDQNGNLLPGIPIDWKSDRDNSVISFSKLQTITNEQGIAETAITSTKAFDVVVTASTNASSKSALPITFVADNSKGVITQFLGNRQTLTADGQDSAELMAKVEDRHGNSLKGVAVMLDNDNDAIITPKQTITDADGNIYATLATKHAGAVVITAKLDNRAEKTLSLTAEADVQTATIKVTSDSSTTTVGENGVTLKATVVDAHNNPVIGTSVAWRSDSNVLDSSISVTNGQGEATVHLSGTQAIVTIVTAVLYNGNEGAEKVTFRPGKPDMDHSQLNVTPQSVTADGKSAATATLILRDLWDNPVPEQIVDWSANESSIVFSPAEKGDGVYLAQVTGIKEGSWILTARNDSAVLQAQLGFLASEDSVVIDSVTVYGTDTAKADGLDKVTLRVQVKDKNGNTNMPGVSVGWQTSLGALSSPLSKTNEGGVAEITLTSTQAGRAWGSAVLGGGQQVNADKVVTFTVGHISVDKSSLSVTPSSIVAEVETTTIRVTARDAEGNLLAGLRDDITLKYSADLAMTEIVFEEVTDGVYEAQVTGKKSGITEITALVNGVAINKKAALTLKADNSSAVVKGQISVTPTSAVVEEIVTYTAVLMDINGNALGAGIPVIWNANDGSTLNALVSNTDYTGSVHATLTRVQAGTAKVSLVLPSGITAAPNVVFSADQPDNNRSELSLMPSVIVAGKESAILTLVLRDKNGNPLSNQAVSGESDNNTVTISDSQENSGKHGNYTMTVTGKKAGTAGLSVRVNDKLFIHTKVLTVKGNTDSWQITQVKPDKGSFVAGDGKGVIYTAIVTDAEGNKLSNVVVSWQLSGQAESFTPTSRTDSNGIAFTTVKSHTAGKLIMTAYLDESNHVQANEVTVHPSEVDTVKSTFVADKNTISSDGIDAVTLMVRLKDSYGNVIAGKKVSIERMNTLPGFTVSELTDNKDGSYQAKATSTAKGQVTLNAKVDGKIIGAGVTVNVGAITPDLYFANEYQNVDYTRTFKESQSPRGMPDSVLQLWSSSEPDVASIDSRTGTVSLLKSGASIITVQTSGNGQYNPTQATYTLTINKADPKLKAGNGTPVMATWADGKAHTIAASFGNVDVGSGLKAQYTSENTAVVTVNNDGTLTAVKPGGTIVTVNTPETEQFKAASANVAYTLGKAVIALTFKNDKDKYRYDEKVILQSFARPLPDEIKSRIAWKSNSPEIVEIVDSQIKKVVPGNAVIIASITADDFYEGTSGNYQIFIYDNPKVDVSLRGTQMGSEVLFGNNEWNVVYKDDALIFHWNKILTGGHSPIEEASIKIFRGSALLHEVNVPATDLDKDAGVFRIDFSNIGVKLNETLTLKSTWKGFKGLNSEGKSLEVIVNPVKNYSEIYKLSLSLGQQLYHNNGAPGTTGGHVSTGRCTGGDWAMAKIFYSLTYKGEYNRYLDVYKNPKKRVYFEHTAGEGRSPIGMMWPKTEDNYLVNSSLLLDHPDFVIADPCRSEIAGGLTRPEKWGTYRTMVEVSTDAKPAERFDVKHEFRWTNGQTQSLPTEQPSENVSVW